MKERLARLPRWLRGIPAAAAVAGILYLPLSEVTGLRRGLVLLISALVGALVGVLGVVLGLRQARRVFGPVTTDQRLEVVRAVDAGRLPADPALRPVAITVARQRVRLIYPTKVQFPLFALLLLVALGNAAARGGAWWAFVAFWLVVAPFSIISGRRQQRTAKAVLDSVPA